MDKVYAGIGSRSTPDNILKLMTFLGAKLADDGWILRSGHAAGADQAFEQGARSRAEIYLPWPDYNSDVPVRGVRDDRPSDLATQIAETFHPAWDKCSPGARKLHARNSHIVLGADCAAAVDLIIAWYDPSKQGGTTQAIRIADKLGIEVRNLFYGKVASAACEYCEIPVHDYVL